MCVTPQSSLAFSTDNQRVPETESRTVRIPGKYFIAGGSVVKSFETLLIMGREILTSLHEILYLL